MIVSPDLQIVFSAAVQEAIRRRQDLVCLEHVLLAMLGDPAAVEILLTCGVELDVLRDDLERYLAGLAAVPEGAEFQIDQTPAVTRVLQRAADHVLSAGKSELDAGDVLAAMYREEECSAVEFLQKQGVGRLDLLTAIAHGGGLTPSGELGEEDEFEGEDVEEGDDGEPAAAPGPARDPLEAFAENLVARAAAGGIDPLIGRQAEIDRTIQVLCRRRKNNPLLVGEAGVGKTAIAEGLALAIHEGRVPTPLQGTEIFALDLGALLAGTKFRGDFEQRLKGVVEAVTRREKAVLFIDEIHTMVGAGATSGGTVDAANLLKPALQSGRLRCIGSTTYKDFQGAFEKDRALARRFQRIEVLEPSVPETVKILQGLRPRYEAHHGVRYSERALELAAELSARYLGDRHLPDKAIDVVDEVGALVRLAGRSTVKAPDVETLVARMARIPPRSVSLSDRERLGTLAADLGRVIFGQKGAIEGLVAAIKLSRAGLANPQRPVGSFLFSGPTGVGKTELARQLARLLGVELLRFDMSEYMEKHAVSRLIGAPPGYVGFDQGGLLTDAVLKHPHAVLILDEIEKAHPDLNGILLQVMDHATLTDNNGRKADFRNVVLILTTNAGAAEAAQEAIGFGGSGGSRPVGRSAEKAAVERAFSPEFRNRLDAWIPFDELGPEVVERIAEKLVAELSEQLSVKGVAVELAPGARRWLADRGYDRKLGARPMARLIDRVLRRPLADEILFGRLQRGGRVRAEERGGELALEVTAAVPVPGRRRPLAVS